MYKGSVHKKLKQLYELSKFIKKKTKDASP